MFRKSMKVLFFILLGFVIIVFGDDETRAFLKQKINRLKEKYL